MSLESVMMTTFPRLFAPPSLCLALSIDRDRPDLDLALSRLTRLTRRRSPNWTRSSTKEFVVVNTKIFVGRRALNRRRPTVVILQTSCVSSGVGGRRSVVVGGDDRRSTPLRRSRQRVDSRRKRIPSCYIAHLAATGSENGSQNT